MQKKVEKAIIDLPRAFLSIDNPDLIQMALCGKVAQTMAMIGPHIYHKYVTYDNKGHAILYMESTKAVYRMLNNAMLFYMKLWKKLKNCGFKCSTFYPSVTNATIEVFQMTVIWHVGD